MSYKSQPSPGLPLIPNLQNRADIYRKNEPPSFFPIYDIAVGKCYITLADLHIFILFELSASPPPVCVEVVEWVGLPP